MVSDITCENELGSSEKIDIVSAVDEVDSAADDIVSVVDEAGSEVDDIVSDVDEVNNAADDSIESVDIEEMVANDIILHTSSGGIVDLIDVYEPQSIMSANISCKLSNITIYQSLKEYSMYG